jgi:hypothetical protein
VDNAAAGDIRVAAAAGRVDSGRCVRCVLAPCRAPVPPLISRTPIPADGLNLISHFSLQPCALHNFCAVCRRLRRHRDNRPRFCGLNICNTKLVVILQQVEDRGMWVGRSRSGRDRVRWGGKKETCRRRFCWEGQRRQLRPPRWLLALVVYECTVTRRPGSVRGQSRFRVYKQIIRS